ncbi:hypothetical protein P4O66_008895, partial [Electrophorus voltai]
DWLCRCWRLIGFTERTFIPGAVSAFLCAPRDATFSRRLPSPGMTTEIREVREITPNADNVLTHLSMSWLIGTKSRTALVSFPCVERPSPEGAGASGDAHGATLKAADFSSAGCLVGPSGRTVSGFKLSLESIAGCSGYNSIKSFGVKDKTPPIPDTGLLCEECVARVDVFREKARRLLTEGHFSTNDPKLSVLLCESLRVSADRCDVCSTHQSQLKQEAVRTLLTHDRAIWPGCVPANVAPGSPALGAHTLPRACGSRFPDSSPRQRSRSPDKHCWVTQPTHLHTLWPLSESNGVSSFSHTMSQDALNKKEDEKATSPATVLCQFSGPLHFNTSKVSTMLPAGTSAAVSFIVRAVQKLNLTSRRRKQRSDDRYPTNFSALLHKAPPPVPSNLFHSASKGREIPETGKVKVMLRVSPFPRADTSRSQALKLDLRRRQVIVVEPTNKSRHGRLSEGTAFTPKAFTFDAAFGPGSSQLLNKKKDRTWANISVSVSAVEVCGETEVIRDLLADIESGDRKDTHKSNVCLQEDPICGIKVCNNSVLSAPTAERAAFLLDAALVSRRTGMAGQGGTSLHNCHMFYTLHVCQKHIECSTKSGMYVDQSKLSLIDLGSCMRESNKTNTAVCLVDLGNVIMAKLSGHKHLPNKGSKLAMLMQECLGNVNCCTTIIAHISTSHEDVSETLCTIQIVSQIRRLQKKTRDCSGRLVGGGTLPRVTKRHFEHGHYMALGSKGNLEGNYAQAKGMTPLAEKTYEEDLSQASCSLKIVPSRITAPRKPSHCSGNVSDNTSVLSGELPPAMCKTALLYHRNSTVSSGYESLRRDSEAMCSSTSTHDSISDHSFFFSSPRSSKKRNSAASHQRRSSQDTVLSERRSASGSKICWVDRGTSESYEIKVYEIDSVAGLKKRGETGNKSVVCFSAKLKFLEHEEQRIVEVRAKYTNLKREIELVKQHLIVDPLKRTRECCKS